MAYTDDFASGASLTDLSAPWVQWNDSNHLQKGFGSVFGATSSVAGAIYVAPIGRDHYSEVKVDFDGPGDASKYIYLFVRCSPAADAATNGRFYMFWSDGGSDGQVLVCTSGVASRSTIKTDNAFTYLSGDVLRFWAVGQTLTVWKNGTIESNFTINDGTIGDGFPGGGLSGSGSPSFDNWAGDGGGVVRQVRSSSQAVCRAAYY